MSNYRLRKNLPNFTAFYHQLIGFVYSGTNCESIQDKKVYHSILQDGTIIMSGNDRQKDSKYTSQKLQEIYDSIKNKNFNTGDLFKVGRNRSPLMALMLASGVAEKIPFSS